MDGHVHRGLLGDLKELGGAGHLVTSSSKYNGQWHYAVVTYGGPNVKLYIDGVQVATRTTAGASPENTGTKPFRIGTNSRVTPPTHFFTGETDEVGVWSKPKVHHRYQLHLVGLSVLRGRFFTCHKIVLL